MAQSGLVVIRCLGMGLGTGLCCSSKPLCQQIHAEAPFAPFPNPVRTGDYLGRGIAAQRAIVYAQQRRGSRAAYRFSPV
jgi:hypothetical protein